MNTKKIIIVLPVLVLIGMALVAGLAYNSVSHPAQTSEVVSASAPVEVALVAVGDIMLSRNVGQKIKKRGNDYPFLYMSDYFKNSDIGFANLESPLTPGREIKSGEMTFRADTSLAATLRQHGVSVVSIANNHIPNFGERGIKDTIQYLDAAGVQHAGAGANDTAAYAPAYIKSKDLRFAFLAYNDTDVVPVSYGATAQRAGTAFMNIDRMKRDVAAAKQSVDFVIVSMHSGTEYIHRANKSQITFAHAAIDAGADLVLGHHPHVIQNIENYKGKYIFYSLGNFIFDQMWSYDTRQGLVAKIYFTKAGVSRISLLPILIDDYAQPRPLLMKATDLTKRLQIDLAKEKSITIEQEK